MKHLVRAGAWLTLPLLTLVVALLSIHPAPDATGTAAMFGEAVSHGVAVFSAWLMALVVLVGEAVIVSIVRTQRTPLADSSDFDRWSAWEPESC